MGWRVLCWLVLGLWGSVAGFGVLGVCGGGAVLGWGWVVCCAGLGGCGVRGAAGRWGCVQQRGGRLRTRWRAAVSVWVQGHRAGSRRVGRPLRLTSRAGTASRRRATVAATVSLWGGCVRPMRAVQRAKLWAKAAQASQAALAVKLAEGLWARPPAAGELGGCYLCLAVVGVADRRPVGVADRRDRSVDAGVGSHGDQKAAVPVGELVDQVPAEEPRVGAQRELRLGRQAAQPRDRLGGEADMAPLGGAAAHPGVHHLAGVVAHRHQRVIAQPPTVDAAEPECQPTTVAVCAWQCVSESDGEPLLPKMQQLPYRLRQLKLFGGRPIQSRRGFLLRR